MRSLYACLLFAACSIHIACNDRRERDATVTAGQSELEKKAGWLLGSWESTTPKASQRVVWKKVNDSTFRNFLTFESAMLPRTTMNDQWLELRKGEIWYIARQSDYTFHSKLIASKQHELVFKSQDGNNDDTETIHFYGDSISITHLFKNNVEQGFMLHRSDD